MSFVSEGAARLCACGVEELQRQSLFDFFAPDDDNLPQQFARHVEAEAPLYFNAATLKHRGTPRSVSFKAQFLPHLGTSTSAKAILIAVAAQPLARQPSAPAEGSDSSRFHATYQHTSLSYNDAVRLYDELERIMVEQRVYLNKDLDLEQVCRMLQTNQLYLSQVVNFFAEENFRDYLNGKRVAYLESEAVAGRDVGIGDLWRKAGFGSYSAFRRYLQSSRGITPGVFARSLRPAVRLELER